MPVVAAAACLGAAYLRAAGLRAAGLRAESLAAVAAAAALAGLGASLPSVVVGFSAADLETTDAPLDRFREAAKFPPFSYSSATRSTRWWRTNARNAHLGLPRFPLSGSTLAGT